MDSKLIGKYILNFRRTQGLTQKQLAQKLGVTNKTISKWETGEGYPDITIIPQLAETLGVSIDTLFSDSSDEALSSESSISKGSSDNFFEPFRKTDMIIFGISALAVYCLMVGISHLIERIVWQYGVNIMGDVTNIAFYFTTAVLIIIFLKKFKGTKIK